MHEAEIRRAALLFQQFEFLNTRLAAYEAVLSSRKAMFRAMWNPGWLKRAVDTIQAALIGQANEQRKQQASKPRLTVVGANGR